jgi:hypothetical protein
MKNVLENKIKGIMVPKSMQNVDEEALEKESEEHASHIFDHR